jgi:hypothetical protein
MSRLGPLERIPSAVRGATFMTGADIDAGQTAASLPGPEAPSRPLSELERLPPPCGWTLVERATMIRAAAEESCCSSPGAVVPGNGSRLLAGSRSR